jgi:hypothetical protein
MSDIVLELRTLARVIETKAPATLGEQDAAHLREAADELERLRAALEKLVQTSLTAYHESEAAIAAAKSWHDALAAARAALKEQP